MVASTGDTSLQPLLTTAVAAAEEGAEVLRSYFGERGPRHAAGSRGWVTVEKKAQNDLVSRADREAESAIVRRIRDDYPEHSILAEEGGTHGTTASPSSDRDDPADVEWIIDPLDGTMNFLQGLPIWSVSVACRVRGELVVGVVLEPVAGNRFQAARGEPASWNGRPLRVSENLQFGDAFLATGFPFRSRAALDTFLAVFRDVFLDVRSIRRCGSAALDLAYVAAGIYDGFFEFRLAPWDIAAGAVLIREAGGVVTDLDGGDGFLRSGNIVAASPAVHPELLARIRRHADEAAIERLVPL